ncbi:MULTISPECIES: hypothetical protein [Erysipelotrichaceae]|uniref:hypothetical protein n=1 Tax=Erysipelotrichaceae TaxID=128827 RepID=UPI000E5513A6|nr:hypothetical protein [Absiella sp. AM27-20]RHU03305.1 hypothetical protein DW716_15905 [Absiella sp. AM27-20]
MYRYTPKKRVFAALFLASMALNYTFCCTLSYPALIIGLVLFMVVLNAPNIAVYFPKKWIDR